MTDYLNPHKIYTDRVDIAPGFDSDRTPKAPLVVPTVKESLTTEVLRDVDGEIVGFASGHNAVGDDEPPEQEGYEKWHEKEKNV